MIESFITILVYYFTYIINGYIYLKYNNKKNIYKKSFFFIPIFLSLILTILMKFCFPLILIIFNIIFFILLFKAISKDNIKKCFYFAIILYLIILICDALSSILISNTVLLNFPKLLEMNIVRTLLTIPVLLLELIISKISIIEIAISQFYEKIIKKQVINRFKIFFALIICSFIGILFCLNAYNNVTKIGHIITIIFILMLILLIVILLYYIYTDYQIEQCNKKIIQENNYIKEIAKQDEEFKHNLINNLLGIKTVSNKKTNILIDALIDDYQKDYKNISNINDLPNGIQSIIYRKAYESNMEDLNLIVDNKITTINIYSMLNPKKYNNLCTSIGILFDNALDAVRNIEYKIVEIEFKDDENYIYFEIRNSYENMIDLSKLGSKKYTTKNYGHGIGLNYITKLKNFEIKYELINNIFVTKLKIKKT